jgi:hypothetical protein
MAPPALADEVTGRYAATLRGEIHDALERPLAVILEIP